MRSRSSTSRATASAAATCRAADAITRDAVISSSTIDAAEIFLAAHRVAAADAEFGAPFHASLRPAAFVARDHAVVVGALRMACDRGVASLLELVVAPSARARGLGGQLLARFEAFASYQNCHKASALVKDGGGGEAFLRARGYRRGGALARHFFQADMVEMVKWLA